MTVWVEVVARARGLSGRLLSPAVLAELAQSTDLRDLGARLAAHRSRPAPEAASARSLEDDERRHYGAQLRLLARWAVTHATLLDPLFDDEDCRSLRAVLRGAVAGVPAVDRLAGLIPTPSLPLRALDQLASVDAPASIAALLVTWGNAYGPALVAETSRQNPDLFQIEHALVSTWATRARRAARRGDRAMRTFVERQLDLANLWTALLVAEHGFDGPAGSLFLDGGSLIKRDALEQAAAAKSRARAAAILDKRVRQSPLAAATGRDENVEERVRRALTREQRTIARQQPLGTAPIIEFWLGLRIEAAAIRRIIWSIAAGVPGAVRAREPVEA